MSLPKQLNRVALTPQRAEWDIIDDLRYSYFTFTGTNGDGTWDVRWDKKEELPLCGPPVADEYYYEYHH